MSSFNYLNTIGNTEYMKLNRNVEKIVLLYIFIEIYVLYYDKLDIDIHYGSTLLFLNVLHKYFIKTI